MEICVTVNDKILTLEFSPWAKTGTVLTLHDGLGWCEPETCSIRIELLMKLYSSFLGVENVNISCTFLSFIVIKKERPGQVEGDLVSRSVQHQLLVVKTLYWASRQFHVEGRKTQTRIEIRMSQSHKMPCGNEGWPRASFHVVPAARSRNLDAAISKYGCSPIAELWAGIQKSDTSFPILEQQISKISSLELSFLTCVHSYFEWC